MTMISETISATLNARAALLWQSANAQAEDLKIKVYDDGDGVIFADFGVDTEGGLAAGLVLARLCTADLAEIWLESGDPAIWPGPAVAVRTDHPIEACLASQYAGWQITQENFFAMGSGPMRGLTGKEEIFKDIGYPEETAFRHSEDTAVGILETRTMPNDIVAKKIAKDCDVDVRSLLLCVAPTASIAGHVQVVARSVETALHKLHELKFDMARVVSGFGTAPLPPIARDDMQGIGRTNDAILYGGRVTLWVRGDDASLAKIVDQVPSCASPDFGRPFGELFASYDNDFYQIDPHLFSPAVIQIVNLDTGSSFRAGETRPEILTKSFR